MTIYLCMCVPEIDRAVSAKDIYAGASPVTYSNMKNKIKLPTLEGRLKNKIRTRKEAVKQLQDAGMELTPLAKKYLK